MGCGVYARVGLRIARPADGRPLTRCSTPDRMHNETFTPTQSPVLKAVACADRTPR